MSYVVLARKYRPRSFAEMVGQPHVVQALGNALERGRLHHAYLFTGTRGIGKTTISRILAKSLNCTGADGQGGITAEPCGVCPACTAIDADRYVDYIELDAASNRSIDEIRDLIERAAYKPSVGRFKVFMIDEAHQLTKDAFNALLKTLEEPPEYLKFVLATTDPEKMLPTVLSRCLQFNLRPMAPETVQGHLETVLNAEGVPFEPAALRVLGKAARGSMRDALSLTDQAIAYGGGRVDEAVVRGMLGSVDRSQAAALLQALAERDAPALLQGVDALRAAGLSAAATLEAMATLLQQAAVEQAVPGALDDTDPETPAARALAVQMPADELQLLYSIVVHGRPELALMSDEYGALTMVLLRLFAFPAAGSAPPAARPAREQPLRAPPPPAMAVRPPAPLAADPSPPRAVDPAPPSPARVAEPQPRATPPAAPAVAVAPPEAPADPALGDRWQALVTQLIDAGAITTLTRELAWQAGLVRVDGTRWTLQVERETLRAPALAERLAAALTDLSGGTISLTVQPGAPADTPARREAAERERRQREAEAVIRNDPLVQDLLAQFPGAQLVPGSIKPV
ncbi:DNA polymerase III subunit gamma/tau [Rubrivivax albus]|uniref:DNA polymerase III subunit gamma/tau n=1 Tax=Rubrivivax albus TaxID=2499835 RepID=A0A437JTC9_9BURK|nr:DNA polymerase III subunit gamma/tau [Rubrivivax albus]RVT50409.1 DNA polymerase III subunit gamma/tau [Rubrivivax albus]